MTLRSLFSFSSKALPALVILLCGCSDLLDSGGSTDSSSTKAACAGEGGLFPSPVGPQSFQPIKKFDLPKKAFKNSLLAANTPLVAIVDEACVLKEKASRRTISQWLRPQIEAQPALAQNRAYALKIPAVFSKSEIENAVDKDSCLMHLSEDNVATVGTTVNDPQVGLQKHLDNIDAFTGWDTLYTGLTGSTVIAVIDDGMDMTHPDLSGVLWTNPDEIASNGIDDDGNGYVDDINGYNFSSNIASPAHEGAAIHGTHVAGLAAAQGDNSVGITGVMGRNASIMVLNVFGSNAGASAASIVNAINYARNKGAHVINMSLGGSGTAASVNTAMNNAVAAGTFIAVAAGNSNQLMSASNFWYPTNYAKDIGGAVSVGSIDAVTSAKSGFSNYSPSYVEIAAPGSYSVTGGLRSTYPPSTYAYLQGTSMASPVLAGTAALVIGYAKSQGVTLTPEQVETLLTGSATSNPDNTSYFLNGGQLNLPALAELSKCNL